MGKSSNIKSPISKMGTNTHPSIKNKFVAECFQYVQRPEIKAECIKLFNPVVDMIMKHLYPYIYLCILFILVCFILIICTFFIVLRKYSHKPYSF